eukprot:3965906-Pleurochrysis_carterae.AAC.1
MALSKLRQVGDRTQAARVRGGGRCCAPRETAQVGTAPPSLAPDDRGQPPPHGGRRMGAQLGAEEARKANASP